MNIVGVIPARGGSKGIPGKNLKNCAGKPLIAWTCEAAIDSKSFSEVIVSTDHQETAQICEKLGVSAPFIRPESISGDTSPAIDVLKHALEWLDQNLAFRIDALAYLQPTSPLRTANHIAQATKIFRSENPDALVSVCEVPHQFHPNKLCDIHDGVLKTISSGGTVRRQDAKKMFARNGPAILIISRNNIQKGTLYEGKVLGFVMGKRESVDIDETLDLQWAEYLLLNSGPLIVEGRV